VLPCSLFATLKTDAGVVSCDIDLEAVTAYLSYVDLLCAQSWVTMHADVATREQPLASWSQKVYPVEKRQRRSIRERAAQLYGNAFNEQFVFHMRYGNLYLVGDLPQRYRPVIMVSTSLECDVRNWSSDLSASAHLDVALAAVDVRRASWEPILLGPPDGNDQLQP
jgi:hypothetical protein